MGKSLCRGTQRNQLSESERVRVGENRNRLLPVRHPVLRRVCLCVPLSGRARCFESCLADPLQPHVRRFTDRPGHIGLQARTSKGSSASASTSAYELAPVRRLDQVEMQPAAGVCHRRMDGASRAAGTGFGALLIGVYDSEGAAAVYAGKVGTGFDKRTIARILANQARSRMKPPGSRSAGTVPGMSANAHWVKPVLVAEVSFSEWTRGGQLRHPRVPRPYGRTRPPEGDPPGRTGTR